MRDSNYPVDCSTNVRHEGTVSISPRESNRLDCWMRNQQGSSTASNHPRPGNWPVVREWFRSDSSFVADDTRTSRREHTDHRPMDGCAMLLDCRIWTRQRRDFISISLRPNLEFVPGPEDMFDCTRAVSDSWIDIRMNQPDGSHGWCRYSVFECVAHR